MLKIISPTDCICRLHLFCIVHSPGNLLLIYGIFDFHFQETQRSIGSEANIPPDLCGIGVISCNT